MSKKWTTCIQVRHKPKEHKEKTLQRFADMQNQANHKHPEEEEELYLVTPETPLPDYDLESPDENVDKSVSLFVKRFSRVLTSISLIDDNNADVAEPDPDYLLDDDVSADSFPLPPSPLSLDADVVPQNGQSFHLHPHPHQRPPSLSDTESAESLIRPKRLANPCVESRERQALHRELLLNYKLGKNVLQKPELSKLMLDRRQTQKKKEWQEQMNNKRTSFELKMEERATRLKEDEQKSMTTISETSGGPELMRMHAKITHKQ
ncbi:uncharacterized protein LOC124274661 isoform X3 [Haliotis rubra]|uniref:uncharacterized protein LOC124274661 isoform X3 n=1 Tax=Haliotis rubra TaxID=36100 RepID=UPI001EE5CBE1|nr:uncharacterized protein LOC124274661 isoform X3 [Haliotis rubra]